jgi:hypothetical protein
MPARHGTCTIQPAPSIDTPRKEMPKLICIVIQLSEELKQQRDILKQREFAGFIVCHKVGA